MVDDLKAETLGPIIRENVAKEARLMSDEWGAYKSIGKGFASPRIVSSSTARASMSTGRIARSTSTRLKAVLIFKRGMKGIYQHCGKQHLHRYVANSNSATTTGARMAWMMATAQRSH